MSALRFSLVAILSALTLAAPARASSAPGHERLPLQVDFDRCVLKISDIGNQNIQGGLRLQLLIRESGNVFAAFVHSEKGVDDRRLERCITSQALLWKLPEVALDYSRAYTLTFVPGGTAFDFSDPLYHHGDHYAGQGRASVFMPDINDPPEPARLNLAAAQGTIDIAEWAAEAEVGIANLEVQRYPEAIAAFRQALARNETDPMALRGLAVALAESQTGLPEARFLGEKLASLFPESETSHEAMLRVCLEAGDDACAYGEWKLARTAPDLLPRSRQLAELQSRVEKAAERLRAQARAQDACTGEKGDRARALCLVHRCLDAGTRAFADELSGQGRSSYALQDWHAAKLGEGRMVVTRPTSDGKDHREPRWLVRLSGETVRMSPTNADARHITLQHSSCAVVRNGPGLSARDLSKGPAIEEPVDKLVQKGQKP